MKKVIWKHGWGIILLAGWLLMRPPLTPDGAGVLSDKPVPEWTLLSSYDTVARCEAARENEYSSAVANALQAHPNLTNVTRDPLVQQALFAQCVPAEQIYPPENAGRRGVPTFDPVSPGGVIHNTTPPDFRFTAPAPPEAPALPGGSAEGAQPSPPADTLDSPRR